MNVDDFYGKEMAEWLIAHTLLNKSALCKKAGIDRANFDKFLERGKIPKKYFKQLYDIIHEYGYGPRPSFPEEVKFKSPSKESIKPVRKELTDKEIKFADKSKRVFDMEKPHQSILDEFPFGKRLTGFKLPPTVVYEVTLKDGIDTTDIEKQISLIRAEQMPKHITTSLGKQAWNYDKNKRIEELKKLL